MRPEDAAWIACAIDGEGSVVFSSYGNGKSYRYANVRVYNTERAFVEHFASLVGGTVRVQWTNGRGHKPMFVSHIPGREKMEEVLKSVLPYMIIKRAKAQAVLDWLSEPRLTGRPLKLANLFALYDMEN